MENDNAPATKMDLHALEGRVGERIQALEDRVGERIHALEERIGEQMQALENRVGEKMQAQEERIVERLLEAIQDAETRTLRAFYGFAETNQKRLLLLEGMDANVLSRLGTVESRLLEVEKRLNMPPTQ